MKIIIVFFGIIIMGALFFIKPSTDVAEKKGISLSGQASLMRTGSYSTRVALVMGFGDYRKAFVGKFKFDSLRNPVNDAKDMAKTLGNLGFDVILKLDLKTKAAMKKAVLEFRRRLPETGAVGLFYFSGHGFQYQNANYLVPVRAAMPSDIDIESLDASRDSIPSDFFDDRENKGLFAGDLKAGFTKSPPVQERFEPGNVFRDRLQDGSLGPKMVVIPAGRFRMGDIQGDSTSSDEKPVHQVSIKQFAMGKYEVTVGEYLRFVQATGTHYPGWQEKGSEYHIRTGTDNHYKKLGSALTNENHPVVGISWDDAVAYAEWLSQQTGKRYRLPTEAEWEYAARAGTDTKYWWGNDIGSNKANCYKDYCGDRFEYTSPIGSFTANPFGLYDTVGNACEWTCSEYENEYSGKEKRCISKKRARLPVVRGGSWISEPWDVRAAFRFRYSHGYRNLNVGFRLAR